MNQRTKIIGSILVGVSTGIAIVSLVIAISNRITLIRNDNATAVTNMRNLNHQLSELIKKFDADEDIPLISKEKYKASLSKIMGLGEGLVFQLETRAGLHKYIFKK